MLTSILFKIIPKRKLQMRFCKMVVKYTFLLLFIKLNKENHFLFLLLHFGICKRGKSEPDWPFFVLVEFSRSLLVMTVRRMVPRMLNGLIFYLISKKAMRHFNNYVYVKGWAHAIQAVGNISSNVIKRNTLVLNKITCLCCRLLCFNFNSIERSHKYAFLCSRLGLRQRHDSLDLLCTHLSAKKINLGAFMRRL